MQRPLPGPPWWTGLIPSARPVPSVLSVLHRLAWESCAAAEEAGEPWATCKLSPAIWLGCTHKSLGRAIPRDRPSPASLRRFVTDARRAGKGAPDLKKGREAAWRRLDASCYCPDRLPAIFARMRRLLSEQLRAKAPDLLPGVIPPLFYGLDLETTGFSAEQDRITEIGMVEFVDGVPGRVMEALVNPERHIPPQVQDITGITPRMVRGKPTFGQLAPKLHSWLEGRLLVAHNASFEERMLRASFARAGLDWPACTLVCTQGLAKKRKKHESTKLSALCKEYGISLHNAHRAVPDARACGELLIKLQAPKKMETLSLFGAMGMVGGL